MLVSVAQTAKEYTYLIWKAVRVGGRSLHDQAKPSVCAQHTCGKSPDKGLLNPVFLTGHGGAPIQWNPRIEERLI